MPGTNPTSEKKQVVVYLTGFGPFSTHTVNASWSIVSSFLPSTTIETARATITLLPHPEPVKVAYATVASLIPPLHASNSFSYILHVGVGLPDGYKLEKLAHEGGYVTGDVDGLLPDGTKAGPEEDAKTPPPPGDDDGGRAWGCKLDVEWICNHLEKFEPQETPGVTIPVSTSEDAGRFLCEFIYLTSLKAAVRAAGVEEDGRRSEKVLFMHVPPLGEPFGIETGREVLVEVVKGMVEAGEKRKVLE